jgi:CheY-like chemotaxis protein
LHLSPDLPFITGNKGQLEQVVTDLLISTAEAIDANGGTVRATTGIEEVTVFDERRCVGDVRLEAGHYVYLLVTNANENTTHETIPIFNPFFSTKELGGTLGLSVLRDIIDAHKGGLQVQRQLGVGTTFKILLPVSKVDAAAVAEQPASVQNDKRAVLVVDDEATIREAVADVLELIELNVVTAANGWEGIELFKQYSRDIGLVLLDMNMPVMSGEEAYQRLREIDPQVKVVVSSGRPETEVRERLGKSGAPSFLAKPYDTDTLLTRVKAELSV